MLAREGYTASASEHSAKASVLFRSLLRKCGEMLLCVVTPQREELAHTPCEPRQGILIQSQR